MELKISYFFFKSFLFLAKTMNVICEDLHAIRVVDFVELLILRMSAIVARTHRQEKNRSSCNFFKDQSDWNGASFSCQIRFDAPDIFDSLDCRLKIWSVGLRLPRLSGPLRQKALHLILSSQFGVNCLDVIRHALFNVIEAHRRNESD